MEDKEGMIPRIMEGVGLEDSRQQFEYEKYIKKGRVCGDVGLANNPVQVHSKSAERRKMEWKEWESSLAQAEMNGMRKKLDNLSEKIYERKIVIAEKLVDIYNGIFNNS